MVPRKNESYVGHIFSALAIIVSWGLSLAGAYVTETNTGGFALLVIITCVGEPSKWFANRIIWGAGRARLLARVAFLLWYGACVAASIGLMHQLMDHSLAVEARRAHEAQQRATDLAQRQEAALADLKQEHREAESALEDARSALVPNIRPSAQLRADLRGKLSREERTQLERELASAQANDQLGPKIARLETRAAELAKKLVNSSSERSRTLAERPVNAEVRGVRGVWDFRDLLGYVAASLLELAIIGGIWSDTLYNAGEAEPPAVGSPKAVVNAAILATKAKRFETYLAKEWKAHRGEDGWLEGTQKGWARDIDVSPGYVHAQLMRLEKVGRIEKRADARNTWVRFSKTGELKIVK